MSILDSLLSVATGGTAGLVGGIASGVYSYLSKKLDIDLEKIKGANELESKKLDIQLASQEWAARTQIADVTAKSQVDAEDAKAFAAAQNTEPQRYAEGALTPKQNWLMVILDFYRGTIRPGITMYLTILTSIIYFQAQRAGQADLETRITNMVLFLTSEAVGFYFGQRHIDKTEQN